MGDPARELPDDLQRLLLGRVRLVRVRAHGFGGAHSSSPLRMAVATAEPRSEAWSFS